MKIGLLLASVARRYEALARFAHDHAHEEGLGALVFFDADIEAEDGEPRCEYWPMAKLRDCLRQLDEYDECVYRWLKEVEREDALPFVVFSVGSRPGTLDMSFHKLTHHQAA